MNRATLIGAIRRTITDSRPIRLLAARVANPLFDVAWYRERYKDVPGGLRTWLHWRRHGWREARDPNPFFSTRWYLERYPDVAARRIDPLEHYLRWGWKEGRRPSPAFDPRSYQQRYPDVARQRIDPLLHYLRHGLTEGRIVQDPTRPTGRE